MKEFDWLERTELLVGKTALKKVKNSKVLIAGLGGVGGYAAEQLCRAGFGNITIIDADSIQGSNINRQIIALHSSIGKIKVDEFSKRLKDINPEINLTGSNIFLEENEIVKLLETPYDYVIDAIDTLTPKIQLIVNSLQRGYPLISSMGSGGKTDHSLIKVTDISKTFNCHLARMLRKHLHRLGVYEGFKVVYSSEKVSKEVVQTIKNARNQKSVVGTISYMPAIFGCYCASVVINDIINK